MAQFMTKSLPHRVDEIAPDGSEIRWLAAVDGGSMSHCTLPSGECSKAVQHRTVEEIWYVLEGRGQMWRRYSGREAIVEVEPGTCLTIPQGTAFQFRNDGREQLRVLIVTMPPWPGPGEAIAVDGTWAA